MEIRAIDRTKLYKTEYNELMIGPIQGPTRQGSEISDQFVLPNLPIHCDLCIVHE